MKSEFRHTQDEYWQMLIDGCHGGKIILEFPYGCTEEDGDIARGFLCYLLAVLDSPVEEMPVDEDNPFSHEGYKLISAASFMRFYPNVLKAKAKRDFDRGIELFVTGVNPQPIDAGAFSLIMPGAKTMYSPTVSVRVKRKRFSSLSNIVIGSCVVTSGKREKRYVHINNDLFNLGGEPPRVKAIKPKEAILVTEGAE